MVLDIFHANDLYDVFTMFFYDILLANNSNRKVLVSAVKIQNLFVEMKFCPKYLFFVYHIFV